MDGNHTLHIIPDSRQVKADELHPGVCYLHITAVDVVMEDEDLGSWRKEYYPFSLEVFWHVYLTAALRNELEEPRSSNGDQIPQLQSQQWILQGSIVVQVNSGVLSVCTAYIGASWMSQELQQLIATLLDFMAVFKQEIRVHF
ncbi:Guanine nucleotide exchange factor SPIKE 1 [Linum perenne]